MKTIKILIVASVAVLVYSADMSPNRSPLPLGLQLMSEAEAILGVRRRAARRGVAVGYAAGESAGAEQQQQADASAQQATTADQTTAAAQPQAAAAPPPSYGPLPEGTVVTALPSGCTSTSSGGVEYYHCGENYFRAAFQGNNLVYVSSKPPAA